MLIQKWYKKENKNSIGAAIIGTNTKIVVVCDEETKEFVVLPEDDRVEGLIPKEAGEILMKYGYVCRDLPEET